jgi:hypothetical protein
VPASTATPSWLVVQVGAASVRVETGFDAELLRAVMAALEDSST